MSSGASVMPFDHDLPAQLGAWSLDTAVNGRGEILGLTYEAVLATGERAVISAIGPSGVDDEASVYQLYQTPAEDDTIDWSGPKGFKDLGVYETQSDAFDVLRERAESTTPRDVVGPTQITLDAVDDQEGQDDS